ncbi:MAG TPA: 3'(2'),5'-bisphosphate nucleotidase CysQ, partial [Blastocatellia bacterium]|nr:3'(2'),5'-bisphosphate nucleotidase CysQ [Blastocatellia bacterium]
MERELEVARNIARAAGRVLMDIYAGEHNVEWKGYDDPVTAADKAASELIVKELQRHFPNDAILSEEAPDDQIRLNNSRVWFVDPMDGTKQFIERIGEFAVMIGLAVDGIAKLGVVYQPTLDRMFYAAPKIGSFLEEGLTTKRLHVSQASEPTQLAAAMSRSHHSPKVDLIRGRLGITKEIRSGSVGLKVGLLAEGRAHVYIHLGNRTNLWDTCAPEAILREAGGQMTNRVGEPLRYDTSEIRNLQGVVASNGIIHERVIEAITKVIAE